jgi:hypothetical protein
MKSFTLSEETLGYQTNLAESNADFRLLVGGSKNMLIDAQKKVKTRSGYTRLGAANTALTKVKNAWTWRTSTGHLRPMRFYNKELEVYLEDVGGYAVDAWTRVRTGTEAYWDNSNILRSCIEKGGHGGWYDATEKIDLCLMVNGSDYIFEWNGAVAVIDSVGSGTVTKKGTNTWAQDRFYTSRNLNMTCVRTGAAHTYVGGMTTTTLTTVSNTASLQAGDILIQTVVPNTNQPADTLVNDYIHNFQNHIVIGSDDTPLIYGSKNTSFTDFTYASPRLPGTGFLFTLDNPTRGISSLGSTLLIGAGKSVIFKAVFEQLEINTVLTETANIKRLDVGSNQGFLNQESIVPVGDAIFYLSNEVALRAITDPNNLTGINPKTYSNPIKPDFDAEDWDNAFGYWYKNTLLFTAPDESHLYMLNFMEDADGEVKRFWNPPQTYPVGCLSLIEIDGVEELYGHSSAVPETYLLFDGGSDAQYDGMTVAEKIPIECRAVYAYNSYKNKAALKNFDEYYAEGEITPSTTELSMILRYDYEGVTQEITKMIDGSNPRILEGQVGFNSLAQQSLAVNPLGGLLNPPTDTRKFRLIHEIAKEDFHELQVEFYTNDTDKYWAVYTHGGNIQLSKRKSINIKI